MDTFCPHWKIIPNRALFISVKAVAFYARSTANVKKGPERYTHPFSISIIQSPTQGGAYNTSNGKFTSPISGHYSFTWNILCTKGGWADVALMLNGIMQGIVQANCRKQNVASSDTIVLKLAKDDEVHLELLNTTTTIKVYGNGYSSFSGWLNSLCIITSIARLFVCKSMTVPYA